MHANLSGALGSTTAPEALGGRIRGAGGNAVWRKAAVTHLEHSAGWCKECGGPAWLPHTIHPDAIIVEYSPDRVPLLRAGTPRPPSVLEIKRFRSGLASRMLAAGGVEEAVAVLEDLLTQIGRAPVDPEEAALDDAIVGDLAAGLMRLWRLDRALAVLERLPLEEHRLSESRQRCLALRALCRVRLGDSAGARRDADRLYAQDPRNPLLAEVERELSLGATIAGRD